MRDPEIVELVEQGLSMISSLLGNACIEVEKESCRSCEAGLKSDEGPWEWG